MRDEEKGIPLANGAAVIVPSAVGQRVSATENAGGSTGGNTAGFHNGTPPGEHLPDGAGGIHPAGGAGGDAGVF